MLQTRQHVTSYSNMAVMMSKDTCKSCFCCKELKLWKQNSVKHEGD